MLSTAVFQVGDRVGVKRLRNGTLHFYVNGIDQGAAATNVPNSVYGVIDLYGQAAAATVVDRRQVLDSPEIPVNSAVSNVYR